ncbi:hypothetical protein BGW80DRAFT_710686 [Lactifluus volemus]|nr:hypothetical protein BGW80DRAFT_710686 [Lactifluus volemus]
MQVPSCTNVRIRSTADVHKIFYAVYLGLLPMITRRLDAKEREALSSGYCYAWEDRGPHAITGIGIERFTEGRHWSASRVRDEFLFYYEKWDPPKNKNGERTSDGQPPRDWDPFVKQTYSVYLNENESNRRKWHLTAYFTQATVDSLGTVDDIPVLKDLVVPEGLFKSSRRTKTRSSRASAATHTPEAAANPPSHASTRVKTGGQISPIAGPSSTVNRPPPPVPAQSVTSPQNQGLPSGAYPQDFFSPQPPSYSGVPPPTPSTPHDAYTRMYTGDSYNPSQPHEGYHLSPPSHVQPHVSSLGYDWSAPPVSIPDGTSCQSPYPPYPMLVASQNADTMLHHSPYLYGSGFPTSPPLFFPRAVSPALSHAPSQLSASSQSQSSQSSSESDSPAPGPVSIQTPFFSPEPLPIMLHSEETKFDTVYLDGIHEGSLGGKVCLAPLKDLKRHQPFPRNPSDVQVVQRLGARHV